MIDVGSGHVVALQTDCSTTACCKQAVLPKARRIWRHGMEVSSRRSIQFEGASYLLSSVERPLLDIGTSRWEEKSPSGS
jgi:hypothetical protein